MEPKSTLGQAIKVSTWTTINVPPGVNGIFYAAGGTRVKRATKVKLSVLFDFSVRVLGLLCAVWYSSR